MFSRLRFHLHLFFGLFFRRRRNSRKSLRRSVPRWRKITRIACPPRPTALTENPAPAAAATRKTPTCERRNPPQISAIRSRSSLNSEVLWRRILPPTYVHARAGYRTDSLTSLPYSPVLEARTSLDGAARSTLHAGSSVVNHQVAWLLPAKHVLHLPKKYSCTCSYPLTLSVVLLFQWHYFFPPGSPLTWSLRPDRSLKKTCLHWTITRKWMMYYTWYKKRYQTL